MIIKKKKKITSDEYKKLVWKRWLAEDETIVSLDNEAKNDE